tara:strand:+ start:7631 stop:8083 length:453 start_codon:yes stop_codon:yes gene_type:complete
MMPATDKKSNKKRNIRTKLRRIVVNASIDIARLTELPDKTIGNIIKLLHGATPWLLVLSAYTLPIYFMPFVLMSFFMASGFFILFDGCCLSSVEFKLCGNDDNIIDPYITLFNQKPTQITRFNFTVGGMILNFSILVMILYWRFYYKLRI